MAAVELSQQQQQERINLIRRILRNVRTNAQRQQMFRMYGITQNEVRNYINKRKIAALGALSSGIRNEGKWLLMNRLPENQRIKLPEGVVQNILRRSGIKKTKNVKKENAIKAVKHSLKKRYAKQHVQQLRKNRNKERRNQNQKLRNMLGVASGEFKLYPNIQRGMTYNNLHRILGSLNKNSLRHKNKVNLILLKYFKQYPNYANYIKLETLPKLSSYNTIRPLVNIHFKYNPRRNRANALNIMNGLRAAGRIRNMYM